MLDVTEELEKGIRFYQSDQLEAAAECFKKCLVFRPELHDAYYNLGITFHRQQKIQDAVSCYKHSIKLRPDFEQSYFSLGSVYQEQGKLDRALFFFQKAVSLKHDFIVAHNSMGIVYHKLKRFDRAMDCYRKAFSIKPDYEAAHLNMGNLYFDMKVYGRALKYYEAALQINPDNALAYYNMANSFEAMGQREKAKIYYKKALNINPDLETACVRLFSLLQHDCEWKELDTLGRKLDHMTETEIRLGRRPKENPFLNISRHIDPELNYRISKCVCSSVERIEKKKNERSIRSGKGKQKARIKLGYLSNNFRNHANAQLTRNVFEKHDRKAFYVFCYSYGKDDGSSYRKHIEATCDEFVELRNLNDFEASKRIFHDNVEILIDLVGQTQGSRMGICAYKPAPIQVRYLGMAGTSGCDYFDYIITDPIVTPADQSEFYSEKFVYMPHCYQVNSARIADSDINLSRAEFGLPEDAFVFCCFNTSYKIDPVMFAVWMKILKQLRDSVLWLQDQSDIVRKHLKGEAEDRGVNGNRLIFSGRLPIEEHLARLRLADLALDTRVVNGAASTSDALWAGVPVLTLQGGHFASRMSSSILSAAGLHELITQTIEDYEEKAVYFATHRQQALELKNRLLNTRTSMPLFDTDVFVRNMEKGYKMMYDTYLMGKKPVHIKIG